MHYSQDRNIDPAALNALRATMGTDGLGNDIWPPVDHCAWQSCLARAHEVYSAWDAGRLIAFTYTFAETAGDSRIYRMEHLIVHPDKRGLGIGKCLVGRVIDGARRNSFDAVCLTPSNGSRGYYTQKSRFGTPQQKFCHVSRSNDVRLDLH